MTRFVATYLDPASRLGEVLFGLIMVLTFTLGVGLSVSEGSAGVHELLFAALGCNFAWGIIDGALFVMSCLTVRSGKLRLIEAVKSAPDPATALARIREEIEPEFQPIFDSKDAAAEQAILQRINQMPTLRARVIKDDIRGAVACFLLVFVSCLPAVVPFLIFSDPRFALRVSNFILILMLFLAGWKWAGYVRTNRLLAGLAMVAIGLSLVGVAILLGG